MIEQSPGAQELATLATSARRAIDAGRPLPPDAAAWLLNGLIALLAGRNVRQALNLQARHGYRAEQAVFLATRDQAIRALAVRIESESPGITETAGKIAALWRGSTAPPAGTEDDVSLLRSHKPLSSRQVLRIVGEHRAQEATDSAATLDALLCRWTSKG